MSSKEGDSLEAIDCDLIAGRYGARVLMRRAVMKVFDKLNDKQKGRFFGIMNRWCEDPRLLTPEMFNGNEGRSPRHNEMLQAFKIRKVRLYGFATALAGKRSFVVVDADPSKKQDKADPKILKRAKVRVDQIIDLIERN